MFTLETKRITWWVLLTSDVNIGIYCIKRVTLCVCKVFVCVYFIFDTLASSFQIKELKNTGGANIAEYT